VLVNTSHLVFTLPSKARSFVSFGGLSPLADTALILSAMLPGMPERELPVTPDIFLLPCASVSAVFVQSSGRSLASKDDAKLVVAACAAPTGPASVAVARTRMTASSARRARTTAARRS
jgi:hypothetical protein